MWDRHLACPTQQACPVPHHTCILIILLDMQYPQENYNLFNLNYNPELEIKKRCLPHWELDGSVYFITFKTWQKLELTNEARHIAFNACLFFDEKSSGKIKKYKTFALVIMPDHVHWLMQPLPKNTSEYWSLSSILHSVKSYSSKEIIKATKHIGIVWQDERYDRIIRNEQEFMNTWEYIRLNPIKLGLAKTPENYPFFWQIY
jgi:REP element-mobilizing transposase RayT